MHPANFGCVAHGANRTRTLCTHLSVAPAETPFRRFRTETTRTPSATMAHQPEASLPDLNLTFGRYPSRSSQPLIHFHVGFGKGVELSTAAAE